MDVLVPKCTGLSSTQVYYTVSIGLAFRNYESMQVLKLVHYIRNSFTISSIFAFTSQGSRKQNFGHKGPMVLGAAVFCQLPAVTLKII